MAIDPKDLKGDIALELDADRVSAADFSTAVENFLSLVREVTRQVNDSLPKDSWYVSIQEGSQIISLSPNPLRLPNASSSQIVAGILDGINSLEGRAATPKYFTAMALEKAKAIGKLTLSDREVDVPIRVMSPNRAFALTRRTHDHVSELIDAQYEDSGTVDGVLEMVSAHNGYQFRVYEPVWSRAIRCTFAEDLLDAALAAFKKRVEVFGLIKYAKDGFPVSVKADRIEVFPDDESLPSYKDVRGILEPVSGAG